MDILICTVAIISVLPNQRIWYGHEREQSLRQRSQETVILSVHNIYLVGKQGNSPVVLFYKRPFLHDYTHLALALTLLTSHHYKR